jgi:predicted membrane-bound dolichyl-phosphate-mannose-protein mannosyltransferase
LILITTMGVVEVRTALGEAQTWDEATHIWSGYAYLTQGDYRWNPEHPPLVKLMSALPLLWVKPNLPVDSEAGKPTSFQVGIDFLYKNRVPADTMVFAARSMTILLTLCFGLALAWWTRRRFGAAAGLVALCFYAADPNLIAHGRYVTADVPLAAFFFLSCVLWTDYLLSGRFRDLTLAA